MTRPPTYARRVDDTSQEIVEALKPEWHITDYTKAGWGVFDFAIRHRRYNDLRAWVDAKSRGGKLTARQETFIANTPGPHIAPHNAADARLMARQLVQEYLERKA